tara:strand:+ start:104 stop:346 length:243 start_codon:yes stop_codon:yes gene_type:complete
MSKDEQKNKLPPFEQNLKNIKDFHDNIKMCESVALMVEAARALDLVTDNDEKEFDDLDEMLKSTMVSFSEYIEERGGKWN